MTDHKPPTSIAEHWNSFYASHVATAPAEPSPFAIWVNDQLSPEVAVVEVGCGNGRDSLFFAREGRAVMAFDQSEKAISIVVDSAEDAGLTLLRAEPVAVEDLAADAHRDSVRTSLGQAQVAVYARFFLHAITEEAQDIFLSWLVEFLEPGEVCYVEYRAADLESNQYEFGTHYRRSVTAEQLAHQCRSLGFEVLSSDESRDYAPFRNERPLVGRTTFRKPSTGATRRAD